MYDLFEELQRRQGTGGLPAAPKGIGVEQLPAEPDDSRHVSRSNPHKFRIDSSEDEHVRLIKGGNGSKGPSMHIYWALYTVICR